MADVGHYLEDRLDFASKAISTLIEDSSNYKCTLNDKNNNSSNNNADNKNN